MYIITSFEVNMYESYNTVKPVIDQNLELVDWYHTSKNAIFNKKKIHKIIQLLIFFDKSIPLIFGGFK